MKNKAAQTRTKPRKQASDRTPFTTKSLHKLLSREPSAANVSESDQALIAVVHDLNTLQTWVKLNEHWRKSKDRNMKLTIALRTVLEVLPSLKAEVSRAQSSFQEDGNLTLVKEAGSALELIDGLEQSVMGVGDCALLMHPDTRHYTSLGWGRYADHIVETLARNLPEISKEATYRLIRAVILDITGEVATDAAIKTHMTKGRGVNRSKP